MREHGHEDREYFTTAAKQLLREKIHPRLMKNPKYCTSRCT